MSNNSTPNYILNLATSSEKDRFVNGLYPFQDRILALLKIYGKEIYLTGGTVLSRFNYQHRLSDDLDLFTTAADLLLLGNDFASRLQKAGIEVKIENATAYFFRMTASELNYSMKVEIVREFNHVGELQCLERGFYLNNLEDMGINKITAFEDRSALKDIVDLFYITRDISIERLFELADRKRVPPAYENLLAINVDGISGTVLMLKEIPESELTDFIRYLQDATTDNLKKKESESEKNLSAIIERLLWDFPPQNRIISNYSEKVLKDRLYQLAFPERMALSKRLNVDPKSIQVPAWMVREKSPNR